nr:translation initiation factor IF-2 N-terminal domain-containing protein [Lacticaseibacillus sharpeae]
MGKKRVYELAKELNISSKDVLAAAQSHGIDVNNNMNSINEQDEKTIKKAITSSNTPEVKTAKAEAKPAAPKQEAPKTAASEPKKQKDEVKPASEVKTGTTHANHVSADGKTKISKNAIRRPGTQRPGTQATATATMAGTSRASGTTTASAMPMVTSAAVKMATGITVATMVSATTSVVTTTATITTTAAVSTTTSRQHQQRGQTQAVQQRAPKLCVSASRVNSAQLPHQSASSRKHQSQR